MDGKLIMSAIFAYVLVAVGLANLFMVHPVPGLGYLLLSLIYFPFANAFMKRKLGIQIPSLIKIILGIILIMFTLGVSDLGDMIDKWTI